MIDLLKAVVLGVIQGLTEFLPISSSAHLRIFPELFGWGDPGAAFTAVIQIGTELAVRVPVGERAELSGRVDRLERDAAGRAVVVDLKTGSSKPTRAELARHPQLGVYQLAVALGAFAEEHGFLDLSPSNARPKVGEVVRVIPNHVCVVVNMVDRLIAVRDERIVEVLPVAARGKLV